MITKTAEVILGGHQNRVLSKLYQPDKPGLVAFHNMGSGKTLTALKAVEHTQKERPGSKVVFVTPASLRDNVAKEIDKHGLDIDLDRLEIISYNKAVNNLEHLKSLDPSLVIVDEAHNIRNTGTARYKAMRDLISDADKSLLLTGTMSYNNLHDLGPLVNLVAKNKLLPENKRDFEKEYTKTYINQPSFFARMFGEKATMEERLKNRPKLRRLLNNYVDYHDSVSEKSDDYPEVREMMITREMDEKQTQVYDYLMRKMPASLRKKIEQGLPPTKQESKDLNAFATGFRQASNSVTPYTTDGSIHISPKLQSAADRLEYRMNKYPGHRAVAYSNYIDAGLNPYEIALKKRGIKPVMFTGALSEKEKKEIVDDFNADPKASKVLLLSSSGGEGLDLKGVRSVQILEPHFNKSKIDQVIGRAARFKSHDHLPKNQRNVMVEYYQSSYPRSFAERMLRRAESAKGIDSYLHGASLEKDKLIKEMRGLLTE